MPRPTTPSPPRPKPFQDPRPFLDPQRRFTLLYVLAALSLWWGLTLWWEQRSAVEVVPYSQFEQALREGRVAEVQLVGGLLVGPLKAPVPGGHRALAAELVEPALAERLSGFGVPYRRLRESTWLTQLWSWAAPAVIIFGVWYLL
ncbi:MAG: ATP-dependent metallopeptidase FtsH/Yme1/Tma family protein, partial [Betaproteobacteria bacterium]